MICALPPQEKFYLPSLVYPPAFFRFFLPPKLGKFQKSSTPPAKVGGVQTMMASIFQLQKYENFTFSNSHFLSEKCDFGGNTTKNSGQKVAARHRRWFKSQIGWPNSLITKDIVFNPSLKIGLNYQSVGQGARFVSFRICQKVFSYH